MKKSIRVELLVLFLSVTLLGFGANALINHFFLERYYMRKTEVILTEAFQEINSLIPSEEALTENSDELSQEIDSLCSRDNLNLVVLNKNFVKRIWTFNADVMAARLYAYINGLEAGTETKDHTEMPMFDSGEVDVLKVTDRYQIQRKEDENMEQWYLELWGTLDCGMYLMFRIPLAKIQDNAKISMDFMTVITGCSTIVSMLLIWFLASRMIKPLQELTGLSKKLGELDLSERYQGKEVNEIGELGMHFNQMADALQETFENLQNVNAQLTEANKMLQSDIEEKIRMEEMRKELLANVSHELKTPIALVQGYAEGLQECVAEDEESRQFYCEVIIDEANKMNNLVRKMLTLNELEYGLDKPNMEWFELGAVISSVIRKTEILIEQKNAKIITELPDESMCYADAFKTEEIITNYLSNALNHLDYEYEIRIKVEEEGDCYRLSVTNTGNPVPEEALARLWSKFYKVDKAHTRAYGGSGIGLSIVKAIADSFGQKCGVLNHERSVEFWFTFSRKDEEGREFDPEQF